MIKNIVERSKRRYQDYEIRHQGILDSAIRLFNAKGYRPTTTADIAEAAGVSEPVLYNHFENKKDLFIECFKTIRTELLTRYREVAAKYPDDEIRYLEGVTQVYLDFVIDNPHKSMFLVHLLSYSDEPEFGVLFRRFMEASITDIERIIDRAKQKGTIVSTLNSRLLAGMFVNQYFTVVSLKEFVAPAYFGKQHIFEMMKGILSVK